MIRVRVRGLPFKPDAVRMIKRSMERLARKLPALILARIEAKLRGE